MHRCLRSFNAKQALVEKKATAALEAGHLKQQLALRQRQLEEMQQVASLYIDSDSLARMQSQTGAFERHAVFCS